VCTWAGADEYPRLRFTITADPADLAQFGPLDSQSAPFESHEVTGIGDRAFLSCGENSGVPATCGYSVLTGPYWFGGYVDTVADDVAGAESILTTLLNSIVERLAVAPPNAEWTPPQRASTDEYDCSWMESDGAVAAAIGEPGAEADGPSGPPDDSIEGIYRSRVGAVWCSMQGLQNYFATEFVAGSGWAWDSATSGWAPATVAGAAAGASQCEPDREQFRCSVRALVGETILQGDSGGSTEEEARARTIAAVAAAIPSLPVEP
jgi:hypothetical protein